MPATTHPRLRATAALVAGLLAALAIAGCGEAKSQALPRPTSSLSPTVPPGVVTTAPTAPADQADTAASATEFSGYFAHLIQHATRTRDVTPVAASAWDQAACSSCRGVSEYIEGLKKDKLWETGPDISVGRLSAQRTGASTYSVKGAVAYPRVTFVDADGDEDSYQVTSTYRLAVGVRWDEDRNRWRVQDFTFIKMGKNGA